MVTDFKYKQTGVFKKKKKRVGPINPVFNSHGVIFNKYFSINWNLKYQSTEFSPISQLLIRQKATEKWLKLQLKRYFAQYQVLFPKLIIKNIVYQTKITFEEHQCLVFPVQTNLCGYDCNSMQNFV